jgi:hypothetical protein
VQVINGILCPVFRITLLTTIISIGKSQTVLEMLAIQRKTLFISSFHAAIKTVTSGFSPVIRDQVMINTVEQCLRVFRIKKVSNG